MYALLETKEISRLSWLGKLKRYILPGVGYDVDREHILGIQVLRVRLEYYQGIRGEIISRDLTRIVTELRNAGITRLCLSKNFPGKEFIYQNFSKMDSSYLYECLTGEIAAFAAREHGDTAAFFCRSVGDPEQRALRRICSVYRYIILVTDRDSEIVCRNLRRRFGIAVMGEPTARQLKRADFAVFFNTPQAHVALGEFCVAFAPDTTSLKGLKTGRYVSAVRLAMPEEIFAQIPEGFLPSPIISEAAKYGLCDVRKIKVVDLQTGLYEKESDVGKPVISQSRP